ncbi:ribonuclease III [Paenibacillus sp. 481]|nr:ribonuclease III [Paenibacillus sp. 481]
MKKEDNQLQLSHNKEGEESADWLFPFAPKKDAHLLHPIVLAYMGDAIYETAIRQYLISKANHRPHHLHREATRYVSAKAQARFLMRITPLLTEEEADVVRQGRNTKSSVPRSANMSEYRQATALESLIGYLYFSRRHERLRELLDIIVHSDEEQDQAVTQVTEDQES